MATGPDDVRFQGSGRPGDARHGDLATDHGIAGCARTERQIEPAAWDRADTRADRVDGNARQKIGKRTRIVLMTA
jgi:hypothetical protein